MNLKSLMNFSMSLIKIILCVFVREFKGIGGDPNNFSIVIASCLVKVGCCVVSFDDDVNLAAFSASSSIHQPCRNLNMVGLCG